MRPICVGTGWYADHRGHNNKNVSSKVQEVAYLKDVWYPHIEKQVGVASYVIYQSDCELKAWIPVDKRISVLQGVRPPTQHKHNDAAASMMIAAMHAYCNELSLVFIEQDCLVCGLREAVGWARGKKIVYGLSPYMDNLSRGENSFVFIDYEYLPEFFNITFKLDWHIWSMGRGFPEVMWDDTFKGVGARWPFGYGRIRPINFDLPTFYAQQLTNEELKRFLIKLDIQ